MEEVYKPQKNSKEIVMLYTYMTDRFMSRVVNKAIIEHMISVIMGIPLTVKEFQKQDIEDDLYSKGCRFDIFAVDCNGRGYNIEVQNSNDGADPRRARYNSSKLDARMIKDRMQYKDYPDSYVIFITEKDYFRHGDPIYYIERTVRNLGKSFGDGSMILYVNGQNQDMDTALGRLMHDMNQSDPSKIIGPIMAQAMREAKNPDEEVFNTMCKELEQVERDAMEAGMKAGMEAGEKNAAVKAAQMVLELGGSKDTATAKIVEKFGFSFENAKECVEKAIKC